MHISLKISLVSLALIVCLADSAGAQNYPEGDLNKDYKVDFIDIHILANYWLDANCAAPDCQADLDGIPGVNMSDFALLARNWLKDNREITLVINEFMASNNSSSGIRDEWGDYDDWIEIYNYGSEAINIAGMHLTDNPVDEPLPWWDVPSDNPAATIIPAGGYLLIWADKQQSQGTLHANFALSGSGEQIGLYDAGGNLIDSITFGAQEQNKSYGCLPDGSEYWHVFDNPTPGRSNGIPPSSIIINEIMYHPYHNSLAYEPEHIGEEYIELFNRGTETVNLSGWRFSNGVDFNFPDVTLSAGQYLVVAADVNTFKAKYPGVNNIVGGWTGHLRNSGEKIELADENGMVINRVEYADEGDWAVRKLGPVNYQHRGWEWSDAHDGGGKSLELINPELSNEYGQNWAASDVNDGTPGATNSVADGDIAPLILDVKHSPIIPRPNDPVTVTARIIDELLTGIAVTLHYRVDASAYLGENVYPHYNPNDYNNLTMLDDGAHGDGVAGDGIYGAQIPAHPDGKIIEFFVKASDTAANSRTWPPPSDMSSISAGMQQVTNLLYQVDDSYDPNAKWSAESRPIFYLIMTEAERGRLADIGDDMSDERFSDAQMNGTFISIDGVDMKLRYTVGIRNRGEGTRGEPPNNYRVNFRHDDSWKNITAININSKYTYLQVAGSAIFRMAGLLAADASAVQVRVNGANLAMTDPSRMYGLYNYLEAYGSDWAENHIPDDSGGNIYDAHYAGGWNADLTYLGTNPADYEAKGYYKSTNESENDWNDLFDLTNVLDNEPNATYVEEVNRVLNAKQWLRWFAANTLIGNNENGLDNGVGEDYRLYRGVEDPRFQLLIHDLDTVLHIGGEASPIDRSIFYVADRGYLPVINRFMKHPAFVRQYYAQLVELAETTFSPERLNPLLDQVLEGWVPQSMLDEMKQKNAERIANVMLQIPLTFSISSSLPVVSGFRQTTSNTCSLSGTANAIETSSVLVNGQTAVWTPLGGTWTIGQSITLNPGINRVIVQTFDEPNGIGNELQQGYIDIWYNDGTESTLSGTLATDTTLDAASGPWHVTGDIVVPAGITLTIQPGTTLFFDASRGITINGRLLAEGTKYERIRLTRVPAGSNWKGLAFNNTLQDSRISYTDMDYGDTQGNSVNISYSKVTIDNASWGGTSSAILEMFHPSARITNSYIPGVNAEPIHGTWVQNNEYVIFKGCVFGVGTGTGDIIDWESGDRDTGARYLLINNTFLGGGDDGADLDAVDGYVEGNIFTNFHVRGADTTSNGISSGRAYSSDPHKGKLTIIRNIFHDNDHAILLKEGNFGIISNNLFVNSNDAAIQFAENPSRNFGGPGSGAYIDGDIFWGYGTMPIKYLTRQDLPAGYIWTSDPVVVLNNSIITDEPFLGSENLTGSGNIDADPLFVDPNSDFHLKSVSPAVGTGPNGLDMGVYVPAGACVSGEPAPITYHTNATLTVAGPAITNYKYRLMDNGAWAADWSAELEVNIPITLTGLQNGHTYTVYALGKNTEGLWPGDLGGICLGDPNGNPSKTWTVNTSYRKLAINEILGHTHGAEPDVIELYYDGPTGSGIDLTGMSLTDDPCLPRKFVFSSQTVTTTVMNPGDYMVLYGDLQTQLKNHLGFALSADGDGLYLYDKTANGGGLIDSVVFGPQINDYSIGRVGYGSVWKLTKPTFGSANIAQPLGDPYKIKINEWLANEEVLFDEDFVELYNPCNLPVDMSELYLTDNPVTQPTKQKLGQLSFAPPNGFAVFIADDVNAPGHLDFKLSADRGMIGLFDAERNEIDKVIYGPQTTDISQGRSPDGTDAFAFFELPTPHVANPAITTIITNKTLVTENAAKKVLVPTGAISNNWKGGGYFDDSLWNDGTFISGKTGGVGYERNPGDTINYTAFITRNVETLMYNKNGTCYIRIPFAVDANDINDFTAMTLRVRYDDAFVAYLNGQEIIRTSLVPATLAWNSLATNALSSDSTAFVDFDISAYTNQLRAGQNILAFHGLNGQTSTSSDFLISAEVIGTITTTTTDDQLIQKLLTLVDGLRITEIMYHDPIGSDFDFIELQNISNEPLDINGVRFIDGIEFTFPAMLPLGSGEHVVVVGDLPSFVSRYGGGINVAGEYTGNLSNGGENIILQLPWPYDAAIMRFEYKDSWYPSTDGFGDSLTIRDPYAHPATWNKAESWQASPPSP
ncbi:MAG: lamin tail domain-containing protein [Sedimentisphaerales bacterium]